ncbi:MAG: transglutaminase domain-containing protein [Ilumatobacteraceae bacterium]
MKLEVGCSMELATPFPTPAILMRRPRSGDGQWIVSDRYSIEPEVPVIEYTDGYGNLCQRLVVPPVPDGSVHLTVEATVVTADEVDVDHTMPRAPIELVPDWVVQFLLPSRYCPSDQLGDAALQITAGALPGYPQAEAIRAWIKREITYQYGSSNPSTSGLDTYQSRIGVCRDFAHLGIALCRSLELPARMVVGYLHELEPMDQHAWFEVYLGNRWFTFDATQAEPRGNRVAVAYGRDAADVALITQFGPLELRRMDVFVRAAGSPISET